MRLASLALVLTIIGIPGSLQAARPARKVVVSAVHRVRRGETAAKIARDSHLSMEELAALNPKINLGRLSVGMSLRVKGAPAMAKATLAPKARATVQEAPAPAVALAPVAPLPSIPAAGPAVLVHLERLIPASSPEPSLPKKTAHLVSPMTSQDLAPVFPANSGLEYESAATGDLGFEPADPNHLDLLWPVETRSISSSFGPRMRTQVIRVVKANRKRLVRRRFQGTHKGTDLTAPIGSDVYAATDGQVTFSGMEKGYGNLIIVDHGNGVETRYAHLKVRFAEVGDTVHRGQKIAEVGMTGHTTGPHLHFEVRLSGVARDPMPVLNEVEEIPADMVAFNNTVR